MPLSDDIPEVIVASADAHARLLSGREYLVLFPYHPASVSRIRMIRGAYFERGSGWLVPGERVGILTEILQEVAKTCDAEGLRLPAARRLSMPEVDDISPSP